MRGKLGGSGRVCSLWICTVWRPVKGREYEAVVEFMLEKNRLKSEKFFLANFFAIILVLSRTRFT